MKHNLCICETCSHYRKQKCSLKDHEVCRYVRKNKDVIAVKIYLAAAVVIVILYCVLMGVLMK